MLCSFVFRGPFFDPQPQRRGLKGWMSDTLLFDPIKCDLKKKMDQVEMARTKKKKQCLSLLKILLQTEINAVGQREDL